MYPQTINPLEMHHVADEFFHLDTVAWTSVDNGSSGTNTADDVAGGQCSIVTAATDNDYHFMVETAKTFKLIKAKPIWFTSRFVVTEASTNHANWCLGLSSVVDSTLMADNGGGFVTSFSGAAFYKVDGGLLLKFVTSNGSTQTISDTLVTLVSGHTYRLSFHWDTGDGTTSYVTPMVYDETTGIQTYGPKQYVAIASLAAMSVIYGIKAGTTAAETMSLDYIRCAQKR
jgi:hypothetical protein